VKRRHHVYKYTDIDDIPDYLRAPDLERGAIAKIARDTAFPDRTFHDRHRYRVADEKWFPLVEGCRQARSQNPECQGAIADFIRDNRIQPGIRATQTHLKHLDLDSCGVQTDYKSHLARFCVLMTLLEDMVKVLKF
jgi:hypothetical protein